MKPLLVTQASLGRHFLIVDDPHTRVERLKMAALSPAVTGGTLSRQRQSQLQIAWVMERPQRRSCMDLATN